MLLDLTQQELQESMKFTGLQAKRLLRELNDFKNKRTVRMSPATPTRSEKISGRLIKMSSAVASTVVGAVPSKVNIMKSKKGIEGKRVSRRAKGGGETRAKRSNDKISY